MPSVEIEIAAGASSDLARELRDAIATTLDRYPARVASFRSLEGRALVRAEDTAEAVTLSFGSGKLSVADGDDGGAEIRILGDREAILALTRLPLRHGFPDPRSEASRLVFLRQLGGELTIRGLVRHAGKTRRLLQVLAGG